ncbi:nuclear pore complex protein Nup153-like isoform X2 [Anopheles arabiensis]|uniref:nuclear pore complex protein Nup153-like isoform X2 n=1 Tax=Anopheles arabiensis TaxID=7173 RepID=UPI001AADD9B2|nr:nuclear pore complex protein Nup153-like isoform X2 [Anopheles arabiensis]
MSYMGKVSSPRRTEQRSQEDDDCEEEDEVTPTGRSDRPVLAATMEEEDSDRSNSRNHTNTINSSTASEQDQSLVGKIASNFLSNLSKLVRNAKEKIVSPKQGRYKRSLEADLSGRQAREQLAAEPRKRPRSSIMDKEEEEEEREDEEDQDRADRAVMEQEEYADENDEEQAPAAHRNARTYEIVTKRRRLHEVEPSVAAAPLPRSTIGMRASRAPVRSSKHTQTDRFDRFVAQTGRMDRATSTVGQYRSARNDARPSGRTSLFGRPASVASSDSVFRPYSIHSTQPTATVTSGAEPEDGAAGEPARPFAAYKFGQGLADASGRMTSFLGNAHYRQRMESLQRGAVPKAFFSSHDEPAKSLYSSGSESSVSSRWPSFNQTLFGSVSSLSSGRIPPEYGGSPFYDGLTRYGGASAARTLATNVMVQRSAQPSNSTLVVRQDAASGSGRRREAGPEPPKAPEISSTSQRMRHILDTFSTNKKNGQPVPEQFLSNSSLRRELDELIGRTKQTNRIAYPYPDVHSPRIPEMLQIMREQKSASILNEPVEYVPRPPAVPLMEYSVPLLPADRPASPSERRSLATETRPSVEASKAPEEPKQQLAPPLPNPEHLRGLSRVRWNPLSSQPVTAEGKRKAVNGNETTPTHNEQEQLVGAEDERETEQQEQCKEAEEKHGESEEEEEDGDETDLMEQENEGKELCRSSTPIEGVQQFTFASPIALGEPMELEFSPSPTITFTFASPARCLEQHLETKARSFQELMAESAGKWVCDMCMIRNEPDQQKCMACESAKPAKKPAQQQQQQQQQPSTSTTQPVRSFQELMAESAGKWVCDMCMIRNEPEQQKCMACESAKPAKKPEQQQQPPAKNSTHNSEPQTPSDLKQWLAMKKPVQQQPQPSISAQPVRSFQELMAESAGKWVCDMCMIRNEPEQQKCMACESAKPAKKPEEQQQQPPAKKSSQDSEPHTSIEWKRMLAADSPFSKVPELKDGFQSIVEKMKASTWVCDTCTAQNPIEHGRCLCCEQDRPGGGGAGSAPGKASEAAVLVPKFTFGMPSFTPNTAANSTTIDTQKEMKAADPITSTPSRTGGFLFGAFNGVDRGTSNSVAPAPAPAPAPATAPVPAGLFSFGAPANSAHPCPPAAAVVPEASSSKPSFSFTNTSTTVTSAAQPFVFGASPKVPSAVSFQPSVNSGSSMAPQQQFAASVTGDSNAAPTSLFGLPSSTPVNFNFTTTSNWAESNPVFQFGGKPQPNPSAQISAGQSHQIARRKMIRASRRLQPR